MTTRMSLTCAIAALLLARTALAQAPATTMTEATKAQFDEVKRYLSKTAQKVPEDVYSFRPTEAVRSLGQIIGHVTDANYLICSAAVGEKPPQNGFEKGTISKRNLVKALNDSFAYCDKVFTGMDDRRGVETVKFFNGNQTPRLAVLAFNNSHCNEHYGNLVLAAAVKLTVVADENLTVGSTVRLPAESIAPGR